MSLNKLSNFTTSGVTAKTVRVRPRDAASLLIVDRSGKDWRVLMGKRHMRHVFMPGKFVFPGGRVEPSDGKVPAFAELSDHDQRKLLGGMGARGTLARCRAVALAAIRETYEEAGLIMGRRSDNGRWPAFDDWTAFAERGIAPDLSALRYFARATTPPGGSRRFDTRFFLAFAESIADRLPAITGPAQELEELAWPTFDEATALDIPNITRMIIGEARALLQDNPELAPGNALVQYGMKHGRFVREVI